MPLAESAALRAAPAARHPGHRRGPRRAAQARGDRRRRARRSEVPAAGQRRRGQRVDRPRRGRSRLLRAATAVANRLGDGGIPAPGEQRGGRSSSSGSPISRPRRTDWRGRTVLLVGAGHSAQTAADDLAAAGRDSTRVIWALRAPTPTGTSTRTIRYPSASPDGRGARAGVRSRTPRSTCAPASSSTSSRRVRPGRGDAALASTARRETVDGRPCAGTHRLGRRSRDVPPAPGPRVLRHERTDEAGGGTSRRRRRRLPGAGEPRRRDPGQPGAELLHPGSQVLRSQHAPS